MGMRQGPCGAAQDLFCGAHSAKPRPLLALPASPSSGLWLGEGMAPCVRVLAGTTAKSPRGGLEVFSLVNGEKGSQSRRRPWVWGAGARVVPPARGCVIILLCSPLSWEGSVLSPQLALRALILTSSQEKRPQATELAAVSATAMLVKATPSPPQASRR